MKFFFNIFFLYMVLSKPLISKNITAEYLVKTKGINIGSLIWDLDISQDKYKTLIHLQNKDFLLKIYKFKGSYETYGKIKDSLFIPIYYNQKWVTKKKISEVEIFFNNNRVNKIVQIPKEKEFPRIKYDELYGYDDPLTSFLNILINSSASYTIDGRRTYLFSPEKTNNYTKVFIKEYRNIWADHKRNNLEFLEIYKTKNEVFPHKINIKFKGSNFSLIKN